MGLISLLVSYIAPVFLIVSPLTSYTDQIWSIHRNRSSQGFSLDIPLIMLVASILRVYYWFGARFDTALLLQALIMIGMQLLLLKVALDHRPPPSFKGGIEAVPFQDSLSDPFLMARPYDFWQWRSPKPYWNFLLSFTFALLCLQVLVGTLPIYVSAIGYLALSVEATLPLPQILSNHRARSCKGFRLSVIANWLLGDIMKMCFFFLAEGSQIPLAFKLCGLFQFACDIYLGVQYWQFGEGEQVGLEKDIRLA